jgi:peroxiredoxin
MAPAAPEVALTLLNGEKLSTRRLKGTMYIVHFWSINCATCIEEMPQLVKFYEEFKTKGLELIAVAMAYDSPNYVKHYVQNRPLPFKVGIDSGEIAERFGHVQLTPTTFLMDHRGRIVKRYVGPLPFGALAASIVAMTREAN